MGEIFYLTIAYIIFWNISVRNKLEHDIARKSTIMNNDIDYHPIAACFVVY